jgi:hypothetical protein
LDPAAAAIAHLEKKRATEKAAAAVVTAWLAVKYGFTRINDSTLYATSQRFSPESWMLGSQRHDEASVEKFKIAAVRAGERLPTSSVWKEVAAASLFSIINASDPVDRWLRFLTMSRAGDVGNILDLVKVSGEACDYCRDKDVQALISKQ